MLESQLLGGSAWYHGSRYESLDRGGARARARDDARVPCCHARVQEMQEMQALLP